MALPIFSLNLNHKILAGRVTIGKYDGTHSCLTAATSGDQILVHSPHRRTNLAIGRMTYSESKELALLNINQSVTSLAAGRLNPNEERDTLVVGTPTNLLAFDVENNSDLFYIELQDGAGSVMIGRLANVDVPLAIVGGSSVLQGFDHTGADRFWSLTGDDVCSMALVDFDQDGVLELLVGSKDFDIRIFKGDSIVNEVTETEAVTSLVAFRGSKFGYGLANGTVGVYEKLQRLWRVKSKNRAVSIYSFDLDGDGVEELITGWSNGKIDARNNRTGEVIFKDNLNHSIAGIVEGDYRLAGKNDLICCSVEGEVRGYNLSTQVGVRPAHKPPAGNQQSTIRELFSKKQSLLLELRNYEGNAQFASSAANDDGQNVGVIPAKTRLQTGIAVNAGDGTTKPSVEIALSTNNDTLIRVVMVFAEGIFQGETHVIHPKESEASSKLDVALYPPRDVPVDIHIKALVGNADSLLYHVFELTRQVPRFSMYALSKRPPPKPADSYVAFPVTERIQRIAIWINQNFLLATELEVTTELNVTFASLRDGTEVTVAMGSDGRLRVSTPDMTLAGDIVQSLAVFLNLTELQSLAEFPAEQRRMAELLGQVADLQDVRLRLGAEIADSSGVIRSLVVRAEDSRLMGDMATLRRLYGDLAEINGDLLRGYNVRCANHGQLLEALKRVNAVIQASARLRVGKHKTGVVNQCRTALKNNNVNALIKVMKTGSA